MTTEPTSNISEAALELRNPPSLPSPVGLYSHISIAPHARVAFIAGQLAVDEEGEIKLGVPAASLTVSKGVVSGGGRSVSYGALIADDQLFNIQMPASYGMTPAAVAARQVAGLGNGQAPAKPFSPSRVLW
jgi:hypothetical protein